MDEEKGVIEEFEFSGKEQSLGAYTGGFWAQHKVTVIIAVFAALLIGGLIWIAVTKEHNDFTIAVYTQKNMDTLEKDVMGSFFAQYVDDTDNSGVKSVCIDAYKLDENDIESLPGIALIDSDYTQHVRCMYFTSKDSFDYITDLYEDMFESFDGLDEWIPVENTSLALAMAEYGLDCKNMGLSLLRSSGDEHDAAVDFLISLKVTYPDVFGIVMSPTDIFSSSDLIVGSY